MAAHAASAVGDHSRSAVAKAQHAAGLRCCALPAHHRSIPEQPDVSNDSAPWVWGQFPTTGYAKLVSERLSVRCRLGLAHAALIFICPARSFATLWKGALFILSAYFTLTTTWEFYWLVWLMPFVALAIAEYPGTFWLYSYICFYCLAYAISGWDPGGGFVLPLGDLFFSTAAADTPRPGRSLARRRRF